MNDHERLLKQGFKKTGSGGLSVWDTYYDREDGARAIIEYGPLPHQVKRVKIWNVPAKAKLSNG